MFYIQFSSSTSITLNPQLFKTVSIKKMTCIHLHVIIFSNRLYKQSCETHAVLHTCNFVLQGDEEHPERSAGCNEPPGHAWARLLKYDKLCWHLESSYVWDVIISLICIIVCNASPGLQSFMLIVLDGTSRLLLRRLLIIVSCLPSEMCSVASLLAQWQKHWHIYWIFFKEKLKGVTFTAVSLCDRFNGCVFWDDPCRHILCFHAFFWTQIEHVHSCLCPEKWACGEAPPPQCARHIWWWWRQWTQWSPRCDGGALSVSKGLHKPFSKQCFFCAFFLYPPHTHSWEWMDIELCMKWGGRVGF